MATTTKTTPSQPARRRSRGPSLSRNAVSRSNMASHALHRDGEGELAPVVDAVDASRRDVGEALDLLQLLHDEIDRRLRVGDRLQEDLLRLDLELEDVELDVGLRRQVL